MGSRGGFRAIADRKTEYSSSIVGPSSPPHDPVSPVSPLVGPSTSIKPPEFAMPQRRLHTVKLTRSPDPRQGEKPSYKPRSPASAPLLSTSPSTSGFPNINGYELGLDPPRPERGHRMDPGAPVALLGGRRQNRRGVSRPRSEGRRQVCSEEPKEVGERDQGVATPRRPLGELHIGLIEKSAIFGQAVGLSRFIDG